MDFSSFKTINFSFGLQWPRQPWKDWEQGSFASNPDFSFGQRFYTMTQRLSAFILLRIVGISPYLVGLRTWVWTIHLAFLDRPLYDFWTVHFDTLDRPLYDFWTVHFDTFGPSTLRLLDRPLLYSRTVHFASFGPSTFSHRDRPLSYKWPSTSTHDRPV